MFINPWVSKKRRHKLKKNAKLNLYYYKNLIKFLEF